MPWERYWSHLPSSPGVYSFLNASGKILYVGKAKNLKQRTAAYKQLKRLSPDKQKLVQAATRLKYVSLTSELEALFIEAELIRAHQPPYNILLKDDKSPLYLHITTNETFPTVSMLRKRELARMKKRGTVLGPFPSAYKVKELLHIVRPIFTWCDSPSNKQTDRQEKACFYYHVQQCPGACIGAISSAEYKKNIAQLILFLRGKKKQVSNSIKKEMQSAASKKDYEQAALLRDRLQLITEVTSPQYRLQPNVVLPQLRDSLAAEASVQLKRLLRNHLSLPRNYELGRIEGYDVSNIQGTAAAVAMVVFTAGQRDAAAYRLFNIRSLNTPNDYHMMQEALIRRQNHAEWQAPDLVLIDGGKGQLRAALRVWQWPGVVISLVKNPDRIVIPLTKQKASKALIDNYAVLRLPNNHPALRLLQQVRDEAHRFSKQQHARLRRRGMVAK